MSFIEWGQVPTLLLTELIGFVAGIVGLKIYQMWFLHLDPEKDRIEWEDLMRETGEKAKQGVIDWSKENLTLDTVTLNKSLENIATNISVIPSLIDTKLANIQDTLKLSEQGLEGGAQRRISATIRQVAKQSQPQAYALAHFFGLNDKFVDDLMAVTGSGQSPVISGAPNVDLSRLNK